MLNGSLEPFALTDVLHLMSASKVSGRLDVRRSGRAASFMLQGGVVLGVAPEGGGVLDEDGSIDLALEILDGSGGTFAVEPGPPGSGPVHLGVDELLERVSARRGEWKEVSEAIGSLDRALRLASAIGSDVVTVSAEEWRLLAAVAAGRSAREVARTRGTKAYETACGLAALARKGLVESDPDAPPAAAPQAAPALGRVGAPAPGKVAPAHPDRGSRGDPLPGDEADGDPARLLRELTEDAGAPPRRPLRIPTREEQRMRLRR